MHSHAQSSHPHHTRSAHPPSQNHQTEVNWTEPKRCFVDGCNWRRGRVDNFWGGAADPHKAYWIPRDDWVGPQHIRLKSGLTAPLGTNYIAVLIFSFAKKHNSNDIRTTGNRSPPSAEHCNKNKNEARNIHEADDDKSSRQCHRARG